tara:strand:- start:1574 stop:1981 length:408 start_codon:yes stop_codon:yes gene_type:complete
MKAIITIVLSVCVFSWVVSRPYAQQPTVTASYYGEAYRNKPTASHHMNWEYSFYNPDQFTAAHRTLPFGTKVRVTLAGSKSRSVVVIITDRMPSRSKAPEVSSREIDLSKSSFAKLCQIERGLIQVKLDVIKLAK